MTIVDIYHPALCDPPRRAAAPRVAPVVDRTAEQAVWRAVMRIAREQQTRRWSGGTSFQSSI